jgi:hypothetical protein
MEWKNKYLPDLVGKKFGAGTVTSYFGLDKNGNRIWNLQCECGNTYKVVTGNLNNGHSKGCGCSRLTDTFRKRQSNHLSLPNNEAGLRDLFRAYKKGAQKRNLLFEIDIETFRKLTKENCVYCGKEPSCNSKSGKYSGWYVYNGIDRVDSKLGYVLGNIVPCCKRCNLGKNDMTKDEFFEWVQRIYFHSVAILGNNPPNGVKL